MPQSNTHKYLSLPGWDSKLLANSNFNYDSAWHQNPNLLKQLEFIR